jgi:hypothetical protein
MIHFFAFATTFLACFVYAFIAGGGPERFAMLAQLLAFVSTVFLISFRWTIWLGLPVGVALVDLGLAVALVLLALTANRLWPIILAGMQVATVFAHAARLLSFPLPTAGYAIFVQLWGWPMLFVTAFGTYRHRQRTRRYGPEKDWKPLWPHSVHASSTT